MVVVLLGGRVPFVLCRQEDDRYRLVGERYTHGFMKGQALHGDDISMDVFYIV